LKGREQLIKKMGVNGKTMQNVRLGIIAEVM
jgi:hypothetical protein